mgnify:FL=1|jgi:hypothetical protein|tara:strand:- start:30 stop:308 length:279 start_codon:yes stop_codon:yes gene_type:complete
MNTTSISHDNVQAVLGVNTTYDTMLSIEALILANPMMGELRSIGKLNKTSLMKMALMEFLKTPVSSRRLKKLFVASNDDDKFRAVIQGGQLE